MIIEENIVVLHLFIDKCDIVSWRHYETPDINRLVIYAEKQLNDIKEVCNK